MPAKIKIAHLSGPNATIQNTPPLVTSNKARAKYGLPLLTDVEDGHDVRVMQPRSHLRLTMKTLHVDGVTG